MSSAALPTATGMLCTVVQPLDPRAALGEKGTKARFTTGIAANAFVRQGPFRMSPQRLPLCR